MTRLLKHFDELALKVITVANSNNGEVSSQFPASSLQATFAAATTPVVQLMERRRDPFAETHGWRHGGIND